MTHAQHTDIEKQQRDTWAHGKMHERYEKIDKDLEARKDIRTFHTLEAAVSNKDMHRERSEEAFESAKTLKMHDRAAAIADNIAAQRFKLKEKRKSE